MERLTQFVPATPVRTYEAIVSQFDEKIRTGELKPGDRLPSERLLMKQFNVGRSSVREALRVLQSNGMVRSRPGDPRGPEVVAFSTQLLHRPMEALLSVGQVTLFELIVFRMVTEGMISGMASLRMSADRRSAVDALYAQMLVDREKGLDAFKATDAKFHRTIAEIANNRVLSLQNEIVRDAMNNFLTAGLRVPAGRADYMESSLADDRRILEAIRSGDPEAASKVTRVALFHHYHVHLSAPQIDEVKTYFPDLELM